MAPSAAKHILVIQTAFIGDTILASAFARSCHERWPEVELHFLLRKGNEAVIQGLPFVAHTWVWDKGEGKAKALWKIIRELRKYQFRAVFNLHRHFNSGLVTALMKAEVKVGFTQNPLSVFYTHKVEHRIPHLVDGVAWHEVQRNHQLLHALDPSIALESNPKKLRPVLPLQEKHGAKVAPYQNKPYVVMAPASVWFTKQWEEAKYHQLVARLSTKVQVLLVGGPADKELCERVKGDSSALNLCGQLGLLDSAALMQKAQRVFVNDSGPLHLASAVNAPTTAIFCSTVPAFGYGPLADEAVVMESSEFLDCRPCGLHGHKACPLGHFKCSVNVDVEQVLGTVAL